MTLLITIFAAVISTVIWYVNQKARKMKVGVLCYLFWGTSLMWLVDAIFEYAKIGANFFTPVTQDMLNDTYLGLSVVALALVVWVVTILLKDPNGVLKSFLSKNREKTSC